MTVRSPWRIPEIWPGSTIYILGGGPSLSKTDLNLIHKKHTIGVNQAFRLGNFVDILYFGDGRFYQDNRKTGIKQFGGPIITSFGSVSDKGWPGVRRVRRTKPLGIESEHRDAISWNGNSGASAINIAYWLGAKRVVLIGFDMARVDGAHNWHEHYGPRSPKFSPYHRHMRGWPTIAQDAKDLGLEILNATPGSAITDFPIVPLEKLC